MPLKHATTQWHIAYPRNVVVNIGGYSNPRQTKRPASDLKISIFGNKKIPIGAHRPSGRKTNRKLKNEHCPN